MGAEVILMINGALAGEHRPTFEEIRYTSADKPRFRLVLAQLPDFEIADGIRCFRAGGRLRDRERRQAFVDEAHRRGLIIE